MAVEEFILASRSTALQPGELLVEVRLPEPAPRSGSAYLKFGITSNGRPVIGVAAAVTLDGGACADASVVVSGLPCGPYRATTAERALVGGEITPERVRTIGQAAAAEAPAFADLRGSAAYRRQLIAVFLSRAVLAAAARAQGEQP